MGQRTTLFLLVNLIVLIFTITLTQSDTETGDTDVCFVYDSIEQLRKEYGDNSQSFFGGLWFTEARELYHSLMPDKCIKKSKLSGCQRAEKAYNARKIAKQYVRERSNLIVCWTAKLYDFIKTIGQLDFISDFLPVLSDPSKWGDLLEGGDIYTFWNHKLEKYLITKKRSIAKKEELDRKEEEKNNNQNQAFIKDPEDAHPHPSVHSTVFKVSKDELHKHKCYIDRSWGNKYINENIIWNDKQCRPVCESILNSADKTNRRVDAMTGIKENVKKKVERAMKMQGQRAEL